MCREAHNSRREHIYIVMNLVEIYIQYILHLVELYATIHMRFKDLDELMYDDYDLDYTYTNDYGNLDEYYTSDLDLDEDYARDAHDYESLAYRHYA